jgi:hypothetical protein
MPPVLAAFVAMLAALVGAGPAWTQDVEDPAGALGLGIGVGTALLILLAVLIGLSVLAKLLIVFGVVPREPANAGHAAIHAMANFVGSLTRAKPRRRENVPHDER